MRRHSLIATLAVTLLSGGCVRLVGEPELLPGARSRVSASATSPDLAVAAADGSVLRGHAFTGPDRRFVVVYFGGNGEIVTAASPLDGFARRFAVDLYAVNYRGFAPSSGKASLDAVHEDSLRVFDAIAARPEIAGRPILVYGYSIGTIGALTVATSRPVAGVVLQGAPSAAARVIPKMRRALPWYARGLVRLRPTPEVAAWKPQPIELAPKLTAPLLSLHGTKDRVIAPKFGRELYEAAGSARKTWCPVKGGEHMGLWSAPGGTADSCLAAFLASLER